jgi:hypothetical protein
MFAKLLNEGLDKLFSVNNITIYRDIRHPKNGVEYCLDFYSQKIGSIICFNDFLSCHTDNVRISDEESDFQFVIKTSNKSNAKDLKNITFVQNEREVLFKSGTNFLIEKVDANTNQVFIKEL